MGRRIWLVIAVAAAVLAVVAANAPGASQEKRSSSVTKGLDYFHARQGANAGFGDPSTTGWVIMAAAANKEPIDGTAWRKGGRSPVSYLQTVDHAAAGSANSPLYCSRMIMAYVAAHRKDLAFAAGSKRIDLLHRLLTYQDLDDGALKWSFSPSSSLRSTDAVRTTAWAILAMKAIGASGDPGLRERYLGAVSWLAGQANAGGGFPRSTSGSANPEDSSSTVEDTAAAAQALIAGGVARDAAVIVDAVAGPQSYLQRVQNNDGGFDAVDSTRSATTATAAATEAIRAVGQDPAAKNGAWDKGDTGTRTPVAVIKDLQVATGAYSKWRSAFLNPLPTTAEALLGLSGQNLATFPAKLPAAVTAFAFRPFFNDAAPANKAKFTQTRIVLIRTQYGDHHGGTGIDARKVRLTIDGVDRTKAASVSAYGLHLQLKNVPNGTHTWTVAIVDRAGNPRTLQRTFTVAVAIPPSPTPTQTSGGLPPPTYVPPTTYTPAPTPTISAPATISPTPSISLTPAPTTSPTVSGAPVASPSPSPGAGGGDDGGGSAAGFLGGTLLAMLPIGAAIGYYYIQRRAQALNVAGEGGALAGGGSAWERLKRTASRSKDILKPAGS